MNVSDYTRVCSYCRSDFVRTAKGQPTKYCSIDCKGKAEAERRRAREATSPPRSYVNKIRKKTTFTCTHCLVVVARHVGTRDAGRFCSKACAGADRTAKANEKRESSRVVANLVRREVSALQTINKNISSRIRSCSTCGKSHVRRSPFYRYCSWACSASARMAAKQASRLSASYRSGKRKYKAKMRAVRRGAHADNIDPIKVFERDKWRCHLCGVRTLKSKRGTCDDRAPELEHMISISAGGAHTWGNVACSCRKCNGKKGAESMGQIGFGFAV